jgi:hypothetical protein
MKTTSLRLISLATLAITGLCQARPAPIPDDWKTECIGYFNISVPGEVEVTATSRVTPQERRSVFQKQPSHFASLEHGGRYQVSHEAPHSVFDRFKEETASYINQLYSDQKDPDGGIRTFAKRGENFFSEHYKGPTQTFTVSYSWADGRIYTHQVDSQYIHSTDAQLDAYAREFSEKFRTRKLYEIPQDPGFCIPYGFIQSEVARHPRKMGVKMTLKNHPDITVELLEWGIPPDVKGFFDEEEAMHRFWATETGGMAEKEQVVGSPRPVTMARQKGTAMLVEMTLPISCIYAPDLDVKPACPAQVVDYGYIAYVTGQASPKEDTPNLVLLIMRRSDHGPNGEPTLDRDQLLDLAETVAASVKRR